MGQLFMGSEGSPLQWSLMCLQWALTGISTLKQYDHPNSEKAHPLSCSEAPTFPLGSLLPTQRFSWCISISPPSFVTLVWIFLPPLTEKSSEPGLESLRSAHTLSQTAWKSLNRNYQAESAPCHSEFFSGVAAVFTFVLNAFLPSSSSRLPSQWPCSFVLAIPFIQKNHPSVSGSKATLL